MNTTDTGTGPSRTASDTPSGQFPPTTPTAVHFRHSTDAGNLHPCNTFHQAFPPVGLRPHPRLMQPPVPGQRDVEPAAPNRRTTP